MVLWRISNHADLLGIGGMIASARWHNAGRPVVYLAETPAAALLEVLVHLEVDEVHLPESFQLLKIEIEASVRHDAVLVDEPSVDWRSNEAETRSKGNAWLILGESPLLRVPSAVAPETWNWLLNPRHPDAQGAKVVQADFYSYGSRLIL